MDWIDTGPESEIHEGAAHSRHCRNCVIAVARSGGELYAIEDGQIVCLRHGARFKALIPVTLVWLFAEDIMAYCHVGPWKS
jgi:nitrite reductase/ring-hydroxylating ferredoxin subunit